MQRFLYRLAGAVIPLLVLTQLALPSFLADRLESRLTEDGGSADVSLGAIPALRLLAGDGDRLRVRASGLRLDVTRREKPFDRLDKFGDVSVFIERSRAGPFRIGSFLLDRTGDQRYRILATLTTNLPAIGRYVGERFGGAFGGVLGALSAPALGNSEEIPIQLRATVDSSGDEPRASDGYADVGGVPAGPLALIITDALLAGL